MKKLLLALSLILNFQVYADGDTDFELKIEVANTQNYSKQSIPHNFLSKQEMGSININIEGLYAGEEVSDQTRIPYENQEETLLVVDQDSIRFSLPENPEDYLGYQAIIQSSKQRVTSIEVIESEARKVNKSALQKFGLLLLQELGLDPRDLSIDYSFEDVENFIRCQWSEDDLSLFVCGSALSIKLRVRK